MKIQDLQCSRSKLWNNLFEMKASGNIDVAGVSIVNFETIPHFFLVFHSWILGIAGRVYQQRWKYRPAKIMKHTRADANYAVLTKWVKLQHEKKPVWNSKSIYTECRHWANIYKIYWNFHSARKISLYIKKTVETISVAVIDSSNIFDLYLINIFMKSKKAERCTNMFKLTLYYLSDTFEDPNLW